MSSSARELAGAARGRRDGLLEQRHHAVIRHQHLQRLVGGALGRGHVLAQHRGVGAGLPHQLARARHRGARLVEAETPAGATAQPAPADPLAAAKQEAAANYDRYVRSVADLENFRRRTVREKDELRSFAIGRVLEDIIPVLDNLALGLTAARQPGADLKTLTGGVDMVLAQLKAALAAGQLVNVGTASDGPDIPGLVKGHAYAVLGYEELDGVRQLVVRNPWGNTEPGNEEYSTRAKVSMFGLQSATDYTTPANDSYAC